MSRNRAIYAVIVFFIIILGLTSRSSHFPAGILKNYSGDTLWAMMIYTIFAFLKPETSIKRLFVVSILFCYLIEISQLYHSPAIDSLRENRFVALVLGRGFLWSDLVCYSIGVSLACLLETIIYRKRE